MESQQQDQLTSEADKAKSIAASTQAQTDYPESFIKDHDELLQKAKREDITPSDLYKMISSCRQSDKLSPQELKFMKAYED